MEENPQTPKDPTAPSTEAAPPMDSPQPAPSNTDDKNLAVIAHLLGIILCVIGPLIIFVMKNDEKESFARRQAVEAMNFQITVLIAWIVASVLSCLVIGLFLMPIIWLATLILCIMAAVAASKGEEYRYPFALRLIK